MYKEIGQLYIACSTRTQGEGKKMAKKGQSGCPKAPAGRQKRKGSRSDVFFQLKLAAPSDAGDPYREAVLKKTVTRKGVESFSVEELRAFVATLELLENKRVPTRPRRQRTHDVSCARKK